MPGLAWVAPIVARCPDENAPLSLCAVAARRHALPFACGGDDAIPDSLCRDSARQLPTATNPNSETQSPESRSLSPAVRLDLVILVSCHVLFNLLFRLLTCSGRHAGFNLIRLLLNA